MSKRQTHKLILKRVLDNIIFLEQVFQDRTSDELPDVPFLDLARSFELRQFEAESPMRAASSSRRRPARSHS